MISNLRDISDWLTDATAYWDVRIYEQQYINEGLLKTNLHTALNNVWNAYVGYKTQISSSTMTTIAGLLNTYLNMRYKIVVDGAPAWGTVLTNEDVRKLYIDWYTLVDSTAAFTLTGPFGTSGTLTTTTELNDDVTVINSGIILNGVLITNFRNALNTEMNKQMVYQSLKPNASVGYDDTLDCRDYILNKMHVQEILDYFEWTIAGLND